MNEKKFHTDIHPNDEEYSPTTGNNNHDATRNKNDFNTCKTPKRKIQIQHYIADETINDYSFLLNDFLLELELNPLNGSNGEEALIHKTDVVFFAKELQWRFESIKKQWATYKFHTENWGDTNSYAIVPIDVQRKDRKRTNTCQMKLTRNKNPNENGDVINDKIPTIDEIPIDEIPGSESRTNTQQNSNPPGAKEKLNNSSEILSQTEKRIGNESFQNETVYDMNERNDKSLTDEVASDEMLKCSNQIHVQTDKVETQVDCAENIKKFDVIADNNNSCDVKSTFSESESDEAKTLNFSNGDENLKDLGLYGQQMTKYNNHIQQLEKKCNLKDKNIDKLKTELQSTQKQLALFRDRESSQQLQLLNAQSRLKYLEIALNTNLRKQQSYFSPTLVDAIAQTCIVNEKKEESLCYGERDYGYEFNLPIIEEMRTQIIELANALETSEKERAALFDERIIEKEQNAKLIRLLEENVTKLIRSRTETSDHLARENLDD